MKIKDVPLGSVFLGTVPFSNRGGKFIKCQSNDGDDYFLCIDDWCCESVPEDCLDLEVEVIGIK